MTTCPPKQDPSLKLSNTKHLLSQTLAIWLLQMSIIVAPAIDAYMLAKLSSNDVAAMELGRSHFIL